MTSKVRDLGIKRRQRRIRALALALIGLGAAVVVGLVLWLIFFSTVFAVKRVEVSGTSLLSAKQVQQAAKVPM
ncbi:MAG: cell division protein FtsQ, partial [Propionibacterium sp.]